MRIRKSANRSRNAVTIRWQPLKKRFVIATKLNPGVVRASGFTADVSERIDPLPFVFHLDETIINQETPEILEVLKYAHSFERYG